MPNFIIKTKKLLLLIGDIIILYLSLFLTLIFRYGFDSASDQWQSTLMPFTIIFVLWLIIFFISDMYDLKTNQGNVNFVNLLLKSFIINGIISVVIFYFLAPLFNSIKPQRILIIDLLISFALIWSWRSFFYQFIKSAKVSNNVLILGRSDLTPLLRQEIEGRPQLGYKLIICEDIPDDLKIYCVERKIDILIIANEARKDQEISKKIFDCLSLGIDVFPLSGFFEQITNKIPVEFIEHDWFLENLSENSKKAYEITKRAMDVILAIIGLIVSLIFTPFIALIIKLESPGPIIFKQVRTGKNGKTFLAMKFRSMIDKAEKNGPEWAQKNDARVTKFGKILRKTRLDEIPQLVNILRGEMSFVGPRPERPEFIEILTQEIPFYEERLLTKPGLTGWAQLKGPSYGGSKEESLEKLKYDLYYIKHRSFTLDVSVILKTLRLVVGGKGQ